MWRVGVLLAVIALLDFALAAVKPTDSRFVQRLKRSPNYCDDYKYPHHRPRFWPPPPPPPPFWPPPPPPRFWPPPPQFWPPPPVPKQPEQMQPALPPLPAPELPSPPPSAPADPPPAPPAPSHTDLQAPPKENEPCSTCKGNNGMSSSISNARSENGNAIAVAISGH